MTVDHSYPFTSLTNLHPTDEPNQMIALNLTVRRDTTYGFTLLNRVRNKPRPCKYPWSCASSEPTAQRPRTRTKVSAEERTQWIA